jgi:UDP-N-acetylglucosamine acyltransferase
MMGGAAVHHLVTVGEFAWVGGYSRIHHDVPPFCKIDGADIIRTLNAVGLRRAGYSEPDIEALEEAHRQIFSREKPLAVAMAQFDVSNGINPHVKRLIEFLDRRTHARHGRHQEQMLRQK